MFGRGSTIPTGIFRDLPTETTDGTRHDSIPIAGAIEKKKVKRRGEEGEPVPRTGIRTCATHFRFAFRILKCIYFRVYYYTLEI